MNNLDRFLALLEYLKIQYYSYYDDENNFYVYIYTIEDPSIIYGNVFNDDNKYYDSIIEVLFVKVTSDEKEVYEIKNFKKFKESLVIGVDKTGYSSRKVKKLIFNDLNRDYDEFIDFIENKKYLKKYLKGNCHVKIKGTKYKKHKILMVKILSYLSKINFIENYYFFRDYEYEEDYVEWHGDNIYISKKDDNKLYIFHFIFYEGKCQSFDVYESENSNLGELIKEIEEEYGEHILYNI